MVGALIIVGLLIVIGLLIWGVTKLQKSALNKMQVVCGDAARVLGLSPLELNPDEAAAHFGLAERKVFEPIAAWQGQIRGVNILMGAFTHESNTSVNGVLIPIVTTHVVAQLPRALPYGLFVGRRVALMDKSKVILGTEADRLLVVNAEDPTEVTRVLGAYPELVDEITAFVLAGQGNAFVYGDHLSFMVAHRDPERIREAARDSVRLAGNIDVVFFE